MCGALATETMDAEKLEIFLHRRRDRIECAESVAESPSFLQLIVSLFPSQHFASTVPWKFNDLPAPDSLFEKHLFLGRPKGSAA